MALELGCRQAPVDGNLLAISGSVFSTTAVSMITKDSDKEIPPSSSSPPGVIAGIIISVVGIFVVALALFFIHFRRERDQNAWDRAYLDAKYFGAPGPYAYGGAFNNRNMAHAYRRYHGNAFAHGRALGSPSTAGDYCDQLKKTYKITEYNPYKTKKTPTEKPMRRLSTSTTVNDHDDFSGSEDTALPEAPSPPPPQPRSDTPDSFVIQQYLEAAEEGEKQENRYSQPAEPDADPPRPKGGIASMLPALSPSRLLRARRAKDFRITLPIAVSVPARQEYDMQMARAANRENMRLRDRCLSDGVYAHELSSSPGLRPQEVMYDEYLEVPLEAVRTLSTGIDDHRGRHSSL